MNLRGLLFGTGKTYYILIISQILNLYVIFPFFLMNNNILSHQAFETIMLMFIFGDLIDLIINSFLLKNLLKLMKKK